MSSFEAWLQKPIRFRKGILTRAAWISDFVKNGLYPFIIQNGYEWGISENRLRNCIATGLYENEKKLHIDSVWNYGTVNKDFTEDAKTHFYHCFDRETWEPFWSRWGSAFESDWYGEDRMFDIQEFIWGQLDLPESPQTTVLEELLSDLNEYEYEDRRTARVDVYLQDAQEYGGYGGFRR